MTKIYVVIKNTEYAANFFVTAFLDLEQAKRYCKKCNYVMADEYRIKIIER